MPAGYSGTGYVEGADATASSDFFVDSKKNGYNEVMLRYSAPKADGQNAKRTVTLKINPNENSARNDAQELTLQLPETKDANTWQTAKVRSTCRWASTRSPWKAMVPRACSSIR